MVWSCANALVGLVQGRNFGDLKEKGSSKMTWRTRSKNDMKNKDLRVEYDDKYD